MDFYWSYSSKEIIDPAGKANFFKAIEVASQVWAVFRFFNSFNSVIYTTEQNSDYFDKAPYRKCISIVFNPIRLNFAPPPHS